MSGKISEFYYIGGVVMINRVQFQKINGFSNVFWGWGGEDEDALKRLKHIGMKTRHHKMCQ